MKALLLELHQALAQSWKEGRLVSAPLDFGRQNSSHSLAQYEARPSVSELLPSRQRRTKLHDSSIQEWISPLNMMRGCVLIQGFERESLASMRYSMLVLGSYITDCHRATASIAIESLDCPASPRKVRIE
jgi:hypothetical protein